MLRLDSTITDIGKVTKPTLKALKKVGVTTALELLFYFPRRYLDFSVFKLIKDVREGETVTIRARVQDIGTRFSFRGRISLCEALIRDSSGFLKVVWFNQPYIAKVLKVGQEIFFAGKIDRFKNLQLTNPIYEPVSSDPAHTGKIIPVYRLTEGLYNKTLRNLVKDTLYLAKDVEDLVPEIIRKNYGVLDIASALIALHFPKDKEQVERATFRIAFEDIFIQQLAVQRHLKILHDSPAPIIKPNIELVKYFLNTLAFELTISQKKALWQILQDMEVKHPMNRLLEGDVGSGKTLVAFLAALVANSHGFQVALLAPTEILAKQHFDSLNKYLKNSTVKIRTALLSHHYQVDDFEESSSKKIGDNLKSGKIDFVIGTHALFQKHIGFKNIGLVIIDEQHRFGVQQRSYLTKSWQTKKKNTKKHMAPHLLSLSATPIPRTLALSLYSDLNISTLNEVPKGRQVIKTVVIDEAKRLIAYASIKKELKAGRQAFIVTPRVEEDDGSELKAAKAEFKILQQDNFKEYSVGLIYGGMKGEEKEKVMNEFYAKKIDVLVATSVIEIGIDVPNATIMLIEGSERFGLAQLHQLRGRVGRGIHQSYCLLMTSSDDEETLNRLQMFAQTNDGFKLAEIDLKERGFGSLFGTEQSGMNVKFPQYMTLKTLKLANQAAKEVLIEDPELALHPELDKVIRPLLEDMHLE